MEKDVNNRWKDHIRLINEGKGCPALRDAVKKYGWDAFKFEVLIICFDEDRYEYEKQYIKKFNSITPNGYNITAGGEGGCFIGKKHSEETKEKLRTYFKKYYEDPEKRKQHGILMKEVMKNYLKNNIIPKHTEITKQKMKEKHLIIQQKKSIENNGKTLSSLGKKILQLTTSGVSLIYYKDIKHAAKSNKINPEGIRKVLKGQQETAGGFIWKLV